MLHFQPFELEHKPIIDSYIKPHGFQCSEFTFTNMIIWGQNQKIQWAQQDDVLYVRLQFGNNEPFMFTPIPRDMHANYADAVDTAIAYFHENGKMPHFRSIHGEFIALFQKYYPQFTLAPERSSFDYVYAAEDLIHLAGKKFHAKRNHIHQFTSRYAFRYEPLTPALSDECMALYLSWLQEKDIHEHGIIGEMNAIRFLLPNMDKLGVRGGCIFVGEKLVAFTLGEQINSDTAVIHIEKADASYVGLYAVMNQQFVEHTWGHVTYINREEDMGIPGMRKAKLSYHPVKLIEKFEGIARP